MRLLRSVTNIRRMEKANDEGRNDIAFHYFWCHMCRQLLADVFVLFLLWRWALPDFSISVRCTVIFPNLFTNFKTLNFVRYKRMGSDSFRGCFYHRFISISGQFVFFLAVLGIRSYHWMNDNNLWFEYHVWTVNAEIVICFTFYFVHMHENGIMFRWHAIHRRFQNICERACVFVCGSDTSNWQASFKMY